MDSNELNSQGVPVFPCNTRQITMPQTGQYGQTFGSAAQYGTYDSAAQYGPLYDNAAQYGGTQYGGAYGGMAGSADYIKTSPAPTGQEDGLYPDLYYKIQPQVVRVCDSMEGYGAPLSPETMRQASDRVYDDTVKLHPELSDYGNMIMPQASMPEAVETFGPGRGGGGRGRGNYGSGRGRGYGYSRPYWYGGYGPRGPVLDYIDLLLLNEYNRRNGYYY